MARIKQVFSNSDQLAHVFASQSQAQGRTSSGNLYFDQDTIWSYGSHYVAAKVYSTEAGVVVLLNEHRYSVTTAKHLRQIENAFSHRNVISVPVPRNALDPENLRYLENKVMDAITECLNGRKLWAGVDDVTNRLKALNNFCGYFDLKTELLIPETLLEDMQEITAKKQGLLRTKRQAREEKQAKERGIERQAFLDSVPAWQRFEGNLKGSAWFSDVFLRIDLKNNLVETSRGAEVPLNEALRLISDIRKGIDVTGRQIGSFTVDYVLADEIKIGCHNIRFDEINKAFPLTLVA